MALEWRVNKVKDYRTVCFEGWVEGEGGKLRHTTDALIWSCLVIGMPGITDANKDEFYERISTYEKEVGPMRFSGGPGNPELYITKEDVYNHVGLSTNVGKLGERQWAAKLAKAKAEEAKYKEKK